MLKTKFTRIPLKVFKWHKMGVGGVEEEDRWFHLDFFSDSSLSGVNKSAKLSFITTQVVIVSV